MAAGAAVFVIGQDVQAGAVAVDEARRAGRLIRRISRVGTVPWFPVNGDIEGVGGTIRRSVDSIGVRGFFYAYAP